jgi:hypothetical protein
MNDDTCSTGGGVLDTTSYLLSTLVLPAFFSRGIVVWLAVLVVLVEVLVHIKNEKVRKRLGKRKLLEMLL